MRYLAAILFFLPLYANDWHTRKAEGWAWYEDPAETKKTQPALSPADRAAAIRTDLENKLAAAVLDPTQQNILAYMEAQQQIINNASLFSQGWELAVLNHPKLHANIDHPISQYGIAVTKEIQMEKKLKLISDLSKTHGLFFFFEGNSKMSQAFAPVVKLFIEKHKWEVLAITVDGTLLDGFKAVKPDGGISEKLGVGLFPALVIVHPQTQQVIPISVGLVSVEQIENNIAIQFHQEPS
jgi:conjugal transfer pilus assembly protein TraF